MTKFWLCENIPFNNSYDNVVGFDNETQQQSYFIGLSVGGPQPSNNFRIIDNKVTIRVDRSYEECKELNYMVLLQGGKYYYLFIDSIGYIDNVTTQVNATIDVWQTYMFDYEIKDAFISREHQDRFTKRGSVISPIYSLTNENIELGEIYNIEKKQKIDDSKGSASDLLWYYIVTSDTLYDTNEASDKHRVFRAGGVNGQPVGFYMYALPIENNKLVSYGLKDGITDPDLIKSRMFLQYGLGGSYYDLSVETLLKNPKVISIYVSMYAPGGYIGNNKSPAWYNFDNFSSNIVTTGFSDIHLINIAYLDRMELFNFTELPKPKVTGLNIDSIRDVEREPKLFTKPYSVYSFTNMVSEPLEVGIDQLNNNLSIKFIESFGPQYKSSISPISDTSNYFLSEVSTKNNEIPLLNDKYVNYIMNNKASATTGVALSVGEGLIGGVVGGTMKGPLSYMGTGMALSNYQKVKNEMLKQSDLKQAPISIRETGNNIVYQLDVKNDSLFMNGFCRRVKPQFFMKAYNYFYRYGYTSNEFGVPNLKSRFYFNFIQTTDISIVGNINQNVKTQLEVLFNKGITIWHNRIGYDFKMYDYSKENVEVSLI